MKRFTSFLLALLLCLTLTACGSVDEDNVTDTAAESTSKETDANTDIPEQTSSPILYKVTDSDGNIVWLFGSIHIGRESFYPLPDYVTEAYESADCLAVEFDLKAFSEDLTAQTTAMSTLVDRNGVKVRDKIDADLYEDAVSILEDHGMYSSFIELYMPVMWSMLIDNLLYEEMGVRSDLGIDNHFIKLAYDDGKTILDVESAAFQYTMFASFSEELQLELLNGSVEVYNSFMDGDPEIEEEMRELLDLWETGDEENLARILKEEYEFESDEEEILYNEYVKAVSTDRNIGMTDFAEDALASGDEVFICVGAAHVVGKDAMAELLAERGYTVELITK